MSPYVVTYHLAAKAVSKKKRLNKKHVSQKLNEKFRKQLVSQDLVVRATDKFSRETPDGVVLELLQKLSIESIPEDQIDSVFESMDNMILAKL